MWEWEGFLEEDGGGLVVVEEVAARAARSGSAEIRYLERVFA